MGDAMIHNPAQEEATIDQFQDIPPPKYELGSLVRIQGSNELPGFNHMLVQYGVSKKNRRYIYRLWGGDHWAEEDEIILISPPRFLP